MKITPPILLFAIAASVISFATASDKPVRVYILSGQSNMVGIGQVTSGNSRWGGEFSDPVVSVYEGSYDPEADYDAMTPIKTEELESIGGTRPTPFPGGGTHVLRGNITVADTGVYRINPGFQSSTYNIMEVNGQEVHRREVDGEPVHTSIKLEGGVTVPFKVTYLTDQANGLGWIGRLDVPGTLHTLVHENGKFPHLIDEDGEWKPRDDVWYHGVVTATASQWLNVGCGASSSQIGPELGFGHIVGDHHGEPVLLLKASQGNRSLAWDFLPPGSERFEVGDKIYAGYKDPQSSWEKGTEPEEGNWYAGKQYDDCVAEIKKALENFDESFPHWKGRDYQIAGFVWWQGHKDQGSDVDTQRYEQNLVQLINSLRAEFDAPNAPFVIGTIGFGGWDMKGNALAVAKAQLAVSGEKGKYTEFADNVKTVETRDFWRPADISPRNQDFHYNQNAETYMLVGEAMGKAMVELQKSR